MSHCGCIQTVTKLTEGKISHVAAGSDAAFKQRWQSPPKAKPPKSRPSEVQGCQLALGLWRFWTSFSTSFLGIGDFLFLGSVVWRGKPQDLHEHLQFGAPLDEAARAFNI